MKSMIHKEFLSALPIDPSKLKLVAIDPYNQVNPFKPAFYVSWVIIGTLVLIIASNHFYKSMTKKEQNPGERLPI